MPISLPNLQANPVAMEDVPLVGTYIQGGHGTEIDYYNVSSNSIVPGEPIKIYDRLYISKDIILPDTFGTIVCDCWMDYLVDPDMAAEILQNALVYFDYDLATGLYAGYATGVQPTNGFKLGHAVARHSKSPALTTGVPIAAAVGALSVMVKLDRLSPTSYGTVPNFAA